MVAVTLFAPEKITFVKDYQKARLYVFQLGAKNMDPADYNVRQALISVGSGGLFGKGWRQGTQHELGFLPQARSTQ